MTVTDLAFVLRIEEDEARAIMDGIGRNGVVSESAFYRWYGRETRAGRL
ncbi:MAG: hypothetical protein ACRELY_17000 [Polyangiaceae bacterium]